jgi:NhaA family Na+:H+ antiporter
MWRGFAIVHNMNRVGSFFSRFIRTESSSGIALVVACVIALIFANSPLHESYESIFEPFHKFINEGLMAVFFFLVGLEIKREFAEGEFKNPKNAALPVVAAIGGMAIPALIFAIYNSDGSASNAWAIAMPTDIALALGALALLGSRIDSSLKIFLLTLAIADDLFSIIILGIFYSSGISAIKIASTIGAVLLALAIPSGKKITTTKMINWLHPYSAFLIIPLFALANIGVRIDFSTLGQTISSPIASGLIVGRVVGKIIGITLFAWLAIQLKIANKPLNLSFKEIAGAGALAGMGLTVSLFIADLALTSATDLAQVKVGLIFAALISAILGISILRKFSSRND